PCSRGRSSRSPADRCCARSSHRSPGSPVAGSQYRERSSQALLLSAGVPGAELLAGLALLLDVVYDADHVVADVLGEHVVAAQLAAEARLEADLAAQVHLETFDAVAVLIGQHLAG